MFPSMYHTHLIWLYPYFTCCFIILLSSSPSCVLNLHLVEAIPTTHQTNFDQVRAGWKGSRSWTKRITLWLPHFPAHADESTGSEWVGPSFKILLGFLLFMTIYDSFIQCLLYGVLFYRSLHQITCLYLVQSIQLNSLLRFLMLSLLDMAPDTAIQNLLDFPLLL